MHFLRARRQEAYNDIGLRRIELHPVRKLRAPCRICVLLHLATAHCQVRHRAYVCTASKTDACCCRHSNDPGSLVHFYYHCKGLARMGAQNPAQSVIIWVREGMSGWRVVCLLNRRLQAPRVYLARTISIICTDEEVEAVTQQMVSSRRARDRISDYQRRSRSMGAKMARDGGETVQWNVDGPERTDSLE